MSTQIKITDAAGVSGVFTNPITVDPYTPPKPVTVFGTTPDYNNGQTGFDAHMKLYPKSGIARIYGADCAQWDGVYAKALLARGDRTWFSWKNASLSTVLANWNAIPDAVPEVDYTFSHEANRPTGGPVLADYMSYMAMLLKAREGHRNKEKINIGPIFSWFPATHGNEGIPWEQFMIDGYNFIGWDFYNPASNSLSKPADQLALVVSSGKEYGLVTKIGEWGVQPAVVTNGIPAYTEEEAAAWVAGIGAECQRQNVAGAAYWCSQKTGNPNYHLDSRPLVQAQLQKLLAI